MCPTNTPGGRLSCCGGLQPCRRPHPHPLGSSRASSSPPSGDLVSSWPGNRHLALDPPAQPFATAGKQHNGTPCWQEVWGHCSPSSTPMGGGQEGRTTWHPAPLAPASSLLWRLRHRAGAGAIKRSRAGWKLDPLSLGSLGSSC